VRLRASALTDSGDFQVAVTYILWTWVALVMNSLNRMQPYEPRAFCFDELRVLHKCDIKPCGLACRGEFPPAELLAGGKKIAATNWCVLIL